MTTWELQKNIHNAVKEKLHIGITERELADVISSVCPDWQGDLISGKRTAEIEGGPTDKVIESGDVVLLDLQVCVDGQWSDLTRVYFMGGITDKQKYAYNQVLSAIKAGEKLLCAGTRASVIYHEMRKAIGTEYAFSHHGGHRIGCDEIVVNPRFVPESDEILEAGMIVTLEPAVYFEDSFGIRLENNYLIKDTGFERLCSLSDSVDEYIQKG